MKTISLLELIHQFELQIPGRTVTYFVAGAPGPQGSKTFFPKGGSRESSKKAGPWRDAVRDDTRKNFEFSDLPPLQGPVLLIARFYLRRPKGHYGTGRNVTQVKASSPEFPATYPDADKLLRATMDGMRFGGAFKDDAQVVCAITSKLYAGAYDRTGAMITVMDLTEKECEQ